MLIYLPLHSNPILAERGDYLDGKNTKFLFLLFFYWSAFLICWEKKYKMSYKHQIIWLVVLDQRRWEDPEIPAHFFKENARQLMWMCKEMSTYDASTHSPRKENSMTRADWCTKPQLDCAAVEKIVIYLLLDSKSCLALVGTLESHLKSISAR